MKRASVSNAKNNLSALLAGLKRGPVLIVDRGRPVARLSAIAEEPDDDLLSRQVRLGLVRRGTGVLPQEFLETSTSGRAQKSSAVDIVIAERESGW